MNIEDLRWKVIEVGQKNRDTRKIGEALLDLGVSREELERVVIADVLFGMQLERDYKAGYKFYDALVMWLGQREYWKEKTNRWLVEIAEKYLNEVEKGGGEEK